MKGQTDGQSFKKKRNTSAAVSQPPKGFAPGGDMYRALGAACVISVRPGFWPSSAMKGVFTSPALGRIQELR